ncbi:MAG: chemotaxis protein CheA [Planctomycetaceae bacterium]|nr:chemotaxis protein CheA [Planctomycetaceae bacterium]
MNDNEEYVREFLVESAENLDQLDQDLVALEENPLDSQRLASIFRTVHTIKGTSGFFGFAKLGAITHSGEHLLGQLRDGKIDLDNDVTGVLLTLVDAVRSILERIEKTGGEGESDFHDLSQSLDRVAFEAAQRRENGGVVVTRLTPPPTPAAPLTEPVVAAIPAEPELPPAAAEKTAPVDALPPEICAPPAIRAAVIPDMPAVPDLPACAEAVEVVPAGLSAAPPPQPAARTTRPAVAEQSIRVDVGLLGTLVELVGELVLARNQLESTVRHATAARGDDHPELLKVVHRIDAVTASLQAAAMKTRMQPIEHVFSKFPRIVRDLAVTCGKEVTLEIDGADTELDRSLIETIRDPLTHLVRNAVDHGIEPPEVRVARGKPAAGRLSLRAYHESGQVMVEIRDDGGGIPVDAVRKKAVAKGLVSFEQAALLPDERVLHYIFEPGFSTAAKVTDVSGRGVGMDVVRTNIEAIGGAVDIGSVPGTGTTVRVRIPLTLAIIPALIVSSGSHRFAIPQAAVRELIALRAGTNGQAVSVEGLEGAPVMRLRGRLLPLVFLGELLGLEAAAAPGQPARGTVVVLRSDEVEYGLVVDGVTVSEDIVVKPIVAVLVALGLYAGATVRGDGAVVLILDPRGIAQAARVPHRPASERAAEANAADAAPLERYLVCESPAGRVVAVPLEEVARLETFPRDRIQHAAGQMVVHREGRLTAIADIDAVLAGTPQPVDTPAVTAVILAATRGEVALRVRRILEVVTPEAPINHGLCARGVLGTIAVAGRATEVIDIRHALPGAPPTTAKPGVTA